MESLDNKVAIVTGGSSGIGRAICLALSDEGCKVGVLSRNRSPREGGQPTDTLLKEGTWVHCDVSKSPFEPGKGDRSGSLSEAIQFVVDRYGRLDILVNNAGFVYVKNFLEQTEEEYDSLMDTNLKGSIFATQLAINQMLFRQSDPGGKIIDIGSVFGILPSATPTYGASKAALIHFTQNTVAHFGDKIQCNCVCPGYMDTADLRRAPPEVVLAMTNESPLKRLGKPSELAEVVIWILKSPYVNGATVVVDGGRNARISSGFDFGNRA